MPLCSFDDRAVMFESTPVENLFIEEFMLKAPGDFVKVYLYGLKLCCYPGARRESMDAFARALGLEAAVVENAFCYWERQGIIRRRGDKAGCEFLSANAVLFARDQASEAALYQYRDFNNQLQQVFSNRLITPQEYERAYEWMELLGLSDGAVLALCAHAIATKGEKVGISYMDAIAKSWAQQGILTQEAAEEHLRQFQSGYQGAKGVLRQLGLRRNPTQPEVGFYTKWTKTWGFDADAVLAACQETVHAQTPTFAYLDKILENYATMQVLTVQQMQQYQAARRNDGSLLREAAAALGQLNNPSALQAAYHKWRKEGFEHAVILLACQHAARRQGNADTAEQVLAQWGRRGLHTQQAVDAHIAAMRQNDVLIGELLNRMGQERAPDAADRKSWQLWTGQWGLSPELVYLAGEYALHAKNPMQFMGRILSDWHAKGIATLAAARAEHKARQAAGTPASTDGQARIKQVDARKFEQHHYNDEDFENLFIDLDQWGKDGS